jgi:DNA-binding PadR family transcriptional regulator
MDSKETNESTIDLIILGFLYEKEMNAYDIATSISKKHVSLFLKISPPAVYKRCKRLYSDGYLVGETVKEGFQPEKTIYKINDKGKAKFFHLMNFYSTHVSKFYWNFNAFVWNLEKMEKKVGLQMLQNLHDAFLELKTWMKQHEKEVSKFLPFSNRVIVKQYSMITTTLLRWSEEVIDEYRRIR